MENEGTGSQPQGTESSDAGRYSSFLGTGYQHEIVSEQQPAPTETDKVEEADAQAEPGTEEQPEQQEAVEETEQSPAQPEWLKDYPDDLVEKLSKRYPSAWKRLLDPNTSVDDQFFFRDKLNDAVEIQRLKASETEEPTPEEETPAAQQQATVTATPEQQKQQYYAAIDNLVKASVDPAAVEQLGKDLLAGFGVDVSSEDPEVQELVKNAPKVGQTLVRGAVDLMNTVLPRILQAQIDQVYPGFTQMHENAMYAMTWDKVRNEIDPATQQPLYADLPGYGTPEFGKVMREAAKAIPGFDQMVFTDPKTGRILPPAQQAAKKYAMLAKSASGVKVSPAEVKRAVETGKTIARATEQKRTAGKALGAGHSKSDSAPASDDINSSIMGAYNARHGNVWGSK